MPDRLPVCEIRVSPLEDVILLRRERYSRSGVRVYGPLYKFQSHGSMANTYWTEAANIRSIYNRFSPSFTHDEDLEIRFVEDPRPVAEWPIQWNDVEEWEAALGRYSPSEINYAQWLNSTNYLSQLRAELHFCAPANLGTNIENTFQLLETEDDQEDREWWCESCGEDYYE